LHPSMKTSEEFKSKGQSAHARGGRGKAPGPALTGRA